MWSRRRVDKGGKVKSSERQNKGEHGTRMKMARESERWRQRSDREQWLNFNLCQPLPPSFLSVCPSVYVRLCPALSIHLCVYGLKCFCLSTSYTFEGTQTRRPQRLCSFRVQMSTLFP